MFVGDDGVVCRRSTEIQTQCRVGVLSEYTSLRKNRVFVGSRLVRVFVEERVGVLNHLGHRRTVGLRLIGTVLNVVLSVGKLVAHRTESREFKPLARASLEFCLKFRVKNREVYVVVCEFVLDVERSIIARIELIRVESARCPQSIRVWVYVKIPLHRTGGRIDVGRKGAGSSLLTVGCIADDVESDIILKYLLGCIE